jgi:hypothetical protein
MAVTQAGEFLMSERDITSACDTGFSLAALHQRTVAIQLTLPGRQQLLRGRGVYELDSQLGRILRIEFPTDASCEFVLCEESWHGEILPGDQVACDFLICLN